MGDPYLDLIDEQWNNIYINDLTAERTRSRTKKQYKKAYNTN